MQLATCSNSKKCILKLRGASPDLKNQTHLLF